MRAARKMVSRNRTAMVSRRLRRRFPEFAAEIASEEFAAAVTLSGSVPSANFAAFSDLIRDLTGGAVVPVAEEIR